MGLNLGGIEYETKVLETIKIANSILANVCSNTAAFDSTKPDLYLNVHNKSISVEIKANPLAQLGGTSISYKIDEEGNAIHKFNEKAFQSLDEATRNIIFQSIDEKRDDLKQLIKFFRNHTPTEFHACFNGMPGPITKTAWKNSVDAGLIRPLNFKVNHDEQFIHKHYSMKDCHYFQIGGLGLFYLENNPLDLPIPQLKGDIALEIRATRNGSSMNKTLGEKTATSAFRIQGRLKFKAEPSPYSLDNADDVRQLFNK